MRKKKKLTFDERLRAIRWTALGHRVSWIAKNLDRHPSTIYNLRQEINALFRRMPDVKYEDSFVLARILHQEALQWHSAASSKKMPLKSIEIQTYVEWALKRYWSVTTIVGRLQKDVPGARNRAIRKFFPKGTNFDHIPDEYIQWVEDYINDYPLKVLEFLTPNELWALEGKRKRIAA